MESTQAERANAIQLAAMTVEISYLKVAVSRLDAINTAQSEKLDRVLEQLAQARGGWRTLMLVGGAAGSLGGALSWLASHLKG